LVVDGWVEEKTAEKTAEKARVAWNKLQEVVFES
jgi:hypothetical protein